MSRRTSAARYARALLDIAIKESDPAKVENNLDVLVGALTSHPQLKRVATSPGIPAGTRRNVVESLAKKAGAEPPVVKLLALLAERNRLELLPDLREVYRERLLAHQNIVRASVTSAVALSDEKVRALERRLTGITGKQAQLEVAVDPELIGGIAARIDGTVYDGSIRTQLQRMKQQLVEA